MVIRVEADYAEAVRDVKPAGMRKEGSSPLS
jgi:hypothetical protein